MVFVYFREKEWSSGKQLMERQPRKQYNRDQPEKQSVMGRMISGSWQLGRTCYGAQYCVGVIARKVETTGYGQKQQKLPWTAINRDIRQISRSFQSSDPYVRSESSNLEMQEGDHDRIYGTLILIVSDNRRYRKNLNFILYL